MHKLDKWNWKEKELRENCNRFKQTIEQYMNKEKCKKIEEKTLYATWFIARGRCKCHSNLLFLLRNDTTINFNFDTAFVTKFSRVLRVHSAFFYRVYNAIRQSVASWAPFQMHLGPHVGRQLIYKNMLIGNKRTHSHFHIKSTTFSCPSLERETQMAYHYLHNKTIEMKPLEAY